MKKMFIVGILCMSLMFVGNVFAQSESNSNSNAVLSQDSHEVYNTYNRNYVNPGIAPMPGTNGFFTNPTPDSSFRGVRELIYIVTGDPNATKAYFSEGALEELSKGGDVVSHLQIVREPNQVPRAYSRNFNGTKILCVAVETPVVIKGKVVGTMRPEGLRTTGSIDAEADDGDTNSFQVIGDAGLKAIKDGNNYMVVTKENAHRAVEASGWGIGGHGTVGNIAESGRTSAVGGGGTGYSSDETQTEDNPWIQGYVGVNKSDELLNDIMVKYNGK